MSQSTAIRVGTRNTELYTQHVAVFGGNHAYVNDKGISEVNVDIASYMVNSGQFAPLTQVDADKIISFRERAVNRKGSSVYDPGEEVQIYLPTSKGEPFVAPDGMPIVFDSHGVAVCGIKTAERFKLGMPDTRIFVKVDGKFYEQGTEPKSESAPEEQEQEEEFIATTPQNSGKTKEEEELENYYGGIGQDTESLFSDTPAPVSVNEFKIDDYIADADPVAVQPIGELFAPDSDRSADLLKSISSIGEKAPEKPFQPVKDGPVVTEATPVLNTNIPTFQDESGKSVVTAGDVIQSPVVDGYYDQQQRELESANLEEEEAETEKPKRGRPKANANA